MSKIRKAAVGVVVLGAGLASTSGVAMATQSHGHDSHGHGHSSSCLNTVDAKNVTEGGGLADVAGGAQTAVPINICDIANDNAILNGNDVSLLGGIL